VKPWRWLALRDAAPSSALAVARVRNPDGHAAGWLAAWPGEASRPQNGVRVDPRAIDPAGLAARMSFVLAPADSSLEFDDPAVIGALRDALSLAPADVLSTFVVDRWRFGGAITAVRAETDRGRLAVDPFARLFRTRILDVDAGLLGRMPPPVGPGIQRYGAGAPWPWDRFPAS